MRNNYFSARKNEGKSCVYVTALELMNTEKKRGIQKAPVRDLRHFVLSNILN